MKLVFDIDFVIFDAVSVAQETFITVTHIPTGHVMEFENKTELWGNFRTKDGGWLGLKNKMAGTDYYKPEDFLIVPGARLRPFRQKGKQTGEDADGNPIYGPDTFIPASDGAKKIIDVCISSVCNKLGTHSYTGYTGRGDVFRHKQATLLPYKGNREDMVTPLLLHEMKDYVLKEHNCILVDGIEADDACSMAVVAGYKKWKEGGKKDKDKVIGVAIDKDAKQTEGWHFNPTKDEEPRLIQGFGGLWLNEKGDVDGAGRMWLYYQIAVGDSTDNYKSNCFSKIKYASKGGYNDLKDCKNDKEAWEALVRIFKKLYPEKITVDGCKGSVEIDGLYVMQEMATMAMMLRHEGDGIDVKAVLTKLGVQHDN